MDECKPLPEIQVVHWRRLLELPLHRGQGPYIRLNVTLTADRYVPDSTNLHQLTTSRLLNLSYHKNGCQAKEKDAYAASV